jgi:hypothetical protein
MPTLTNYRGLQVVSPDPTGDGGLAIQNDLKLLADRSLTQTISVDGTGHNFVLADVGQVFVVTAAVTLTFDPSATLAAGWWCYIVSKVDIDHAIVLDPNGSETIDGLTTLTSYFGELRLVTCDGSSLSTQLLTPGTVRFKTNGTFIVPPGVNRLTVDVVDGGGGGGGGAGGSAGTQRQGGTGGGGGARCRAEFMASDAGSAGTSVSITVGAQTGSAAAGANGSIGNPSSFGSLVGGAGGGGGGAGGTGSALLFGGTGGGVAGPGVIGSTNLGGGGLPSLGSGAANGGAGAGNLSSSSQSRWAEWGGASGSGSPATPTATLNGGRSVFGGGAGAAGGSLDTSNTNRAGGVGGGVGTAWGAGVTAGGGGTAGAVSEA